MLIAKPDTSCLRLQLSGGPRQIRGQLALQGEFQVSQGYIMGPFLKNKSVATPEGRGCKPVSLIASFGREFALPRFILP